VIRSRGRRRRRTSAERPGRAQPDRTDVGKSDRPVEAEQLGQLRTTEVGVDDKHPMAGRGESDGQVGQRRRLALTRYGARHGEDLVRPVDVDELQVRAQLPEGFGAWSLRILVHGQRSPRNLGVEHDRSQVGRVGNGPQLFG
jgi:hypothetical protein